MKKYFSVKRLKFDTFCTTLLCIFVGIFMETRSASSDFNIVAGRRVASAVGGRGRVDGWMDGGREAARDGRMEGKSIWRALDEH